MDEVYYDAVETPPRYSSSSSVYEDAISYIDPIGSLSYTTRAAPGLIGDALLSHSPSGSLYALRELGWLGENGVEFATATIERLSLIHI